MVLKCSSSYPCTGVVSGSGIYVLVLAIHLVYTVSHTDTHTRTLLGSMSQSH